MDERRALNKFYIKLFGSRNDRHLLPYVQIAANATKHEGQSEQFDDSQIKAKVAVLKKAISDGKRIGNILDEAIALAREVSFRNIKIRPFDVQLVGANVIFDGKIAEIAPGEGKTIVAALAAFLVYLTGRKVHIISLDDHLAKRDAKWLKPFYEALGMTVGLVCPEIDTDEERRAQYARDVTYGSYNEIIFDYLRDNLKCSLDQMAQGPLECAIINEVDSILIDDARTPQIISSPAQDDISRYKKVDAVARQLMSQQGSYNRLKKAIDEHTHTLANAQGEWTVAKRAQDVKRTDKAQAIIDKTQKQLADARAQLAEELCGTEDQIEEDTLYYNVNYERKSVLLMEKGIAAAQDLAGVGSFYLGQNAEWPHMIEQSLRAHLVFEREINYVVMDGKVIIVDEFTGRLKHGQQWSDGLHQAVEAKENVQVYGERQTLALITPHDFFNLYDQLSGLTSTAVSEADKFRDIYNLEVVSIPTNKPCIRQDREDVIYKTMHEKLKAIIDEVHEVSAAGRPVLVGVASIEKSEVLSTALKNRLGIEHEVINAKQHAREAVIIEKAGHQHIARNGSVCGNVTIVANVAGYGRNIKLAPEVVTLGGLHVIGSERHELRRIDNKLKSRSGCLGDPGSSVFILSLDDGLMCAFAPDWTVKVLSMTGWEDGMPLHRNSIRKSIEKIQKKNDNSNFKSLKRSLEYDEVMDHQRKAFYSRRRKIIENNNTKTIVEKMIRNAIGATAEKMFTLEYPLQCICEWASTTFGVSLTTEDVQGKKSSRIAKIICEQAKKNIANDISISLGEYLADYHDPRTWSLEALCKWAMITFEIGLSTPKLRRMSAKNIENTLIEAACEQVDKKDTSRINDFLKEDYVSRMFTIWARDKFGLKIDLQEIKNCSPQQAKQRVVEKVAEIYSTCEVEYPVEFAMNIVLAKQNPNIHAFELLADWARRKYQFTLTAEEMAASNPKEIHAKLVGMSRDWQDHRLEAVIHEHLATDTPEQLADWAKSRFEADIDYDNLNDKSVAKEILLKAGRDFLRKELLDLERFVLIQVFDTTWKDHLYAMDHLKESIKLRAYAESEPLTEYKEGGEKLFNEMLQTIEDRVTDIIFRVRLQSGYKNRNSHTMCEIEKNEASHLEIANCQSDGAKISSEWQSKVGCNDPCPCGSGRKYKKCCGIS